MRNLNKEQSVKGSVKRRRRATRRTAAASITAWKWRHLWVVLLAIAGVLAFAESRAEWSPMHRWNRAVGDTSTLLVSLAMAVGPLARLWSWCRRFLPWV